MHSQITHNRSILQEKDWIFTRFRKFLFYTFVTDKREEANNSTKNQRQDLLGLQLCCLFPNRHWRDLSLPTDRRGHGVFGPRLYGWYERDMTLLFVGRSNWAPLSGACQVGQELNLIFLEYLTEVLLAELTGVALPLPLPLAVPTLLLWIFGLDFSTTSKSLICSSSLSDEGEATNS